MSSPFPVRLQGQLIKRIDQIAAQSGLTRSDIIRLCLNRFLEDFEANPAELMNRDWSQVLNKFDGRKNRGGEAVQTAMLNDAPNAPNAEPLTDRPGTQTPR